MVKKKTTFVSIVIAVTGSAAPASKSTMKLGRDVVNHDDCGN